MGQRGVTKRIHTIRQANSKSHMRRWGCGRTILDLSSDGIILLTFKPDILT